MRCNTMDLNDTASDFKETRKKRTKYVSNTKNKLSRSKKQKTDNEVGERGTQIEKNSQASSKNEGTCSSGEVIIKPITSSYFCDEKLVPCNKSNISKGTLLHMGPSPNSTEFILISEPSRDEAESCNLSTKTESEFPSAEDVTFANRDHPHNVVSSGSTVFQQKSEGSVSTATDSSSEHDEEKWWCIFCSNSLPSVKRGEHIKTCILQAKYRTSVKEKVSCPKVIKDHPGGFLCEVCKKDISHMSLQNRNEHINSCIDSQTADHKLPLASHDPTPEARRECINISECPVCGKQFASLETRLIHVKKCCKKHKMEPQQIIIALQLQEKHALERIAVGLPPLQIKPSSLKSNANPKPRRRKVPLQISDPDLQIAMALSLSLKEEEKRKQEALGLLLDEPDGLVFSAQESGNGRPPVELKPPGEGQMPGRTKPRNKKNDPNKPVPALLLRTEEERLKLLQERVSSIVAPVSPQKELPQTSAALASEAPNVVGADRCSESSGNLCDPGNSAKHCELWTLNGLAQEKDAYYVPELQEWVSHSEVIAGSKLRHLSQLPGHKISHDSSFEYSTFYTHEDQYLSQNCTVKPLLDIPSTQEMLDVITKDDTSPSNTILDDLQKPELAPSHCDDLYFAGELKNNGFFPELLKNINHNITNPVIDCLRKLVGNSWMSDVNIIVDEKRSIPAHKLLLMLRCPAIGKGLQESHSGMSLLDWTCTPLKAAMEFLRFIYTGFCQLDCNFKKEISQLFYRYGMAEVYETLKNDIGTTETANEGRSSTYDDISYERDANFDAFLANPDNANGYNVVMDQDAAPEYLGDHKIHPKSSDFIKRRVTSDHENNCCSKDTSFISDHEAESTVISIKKLSPATSPVSHHFSQLTNSSNHDIEIVGEEEMDNSGFINITKSTDFSSQTLYKNAMFSQQAGRKSLEENSSFKYSEVLREGSRHSSKEHLLLNCDEDVKYLCCPSKGQCLNQSKVPSNDEDESGCDQNSKLSVNFGKRINTEDKSEHSSNGLGSPKAFKNCPTVHDKDHISPLKQDVSVIEGEKSPPHKLYEIETKKLIAGNHESKSFNTASVRCINSLLDTYHSDCFFSPKAGVENSPELLVCDSDEEICVVRSLKDIPSNHNGTSVPRSANFPEEPHSPHLPEVGAVFSQNSISRSPVQESVFINEVSIKNHNMSQSYVFKPSKVSSPETKTDSSYHNRNSYKGIFDSAIKDSGGCENNDYLPDLIVDNAQISTSGTLLTTPTSSKSNSSFKKQKRKLPKTISPVLANELDISFKKIKVDAQKFRPSDICPVFSVEDERYTTVDKNTVLDRRDVVVNKTFGQLGILNTVTYKSAQSVLSNSKSFPSRIAQSCADDDDGSEAESEAVCANDQNSVPDVWEGFDDDGFAGDLIICGSYDTTLLTPLKSSRNRPPTPHPSSTRKSAEKLSFVNEDASPSVSPVPTPVELVDLDSSPILVRPLGERLGVVNERRKSCSMQATQKEVPDIRLQHEGHKIDPRKEIHLVPHVVTPETETTVKSKKVENCTVTSSPITPMPDFKKMITPELKEQLKRYGVRALPRRKAVSLLTHIYDETHPWQVEAELNCKSKEPVCVTTSPTKLSPKKPSQRCKKAGALPSPQKAKECEKQKVSKTSKQSNRKENKKSSNCKTSREANLKNNPQWNNHEKDELNFSSSQTSSFNESSDFPEESILKSSEDSDDELITPSQSLSLEERISNYILSDQHLYTKILMYEPLSLSDFQQQLKQHGIKVGQTKLMDFLDDKCITFTLPRSEKKQKKQQERNKRFRKRVLSQLSQEPKL